MGDCRPHPHHFWPTLMKRTQFSEFSISRFPTYIRKAFLMYSGRKYFYTNSYNSAMTVIAQDDHLTAGARAAYDPRELNGNRTSK